jgi:hypothetical protein
LAAKAMACKITSSKYCGGLCRIPIAEARLFLKKASHDRRLHLRRHSLVDVRNAAGQTLLDHDEFINRRPRCKAWPR